jgi:hypothetical protein
MNFFTKRLSDDQKSELMSVMTVVEGGFCIQWVAESVEKRKAYNDSRRKNRVKSYDNHMNNICDSHDRHMENEIENENTIINKTELKEGMQGEIPEQPKKKVFIPPTFEEFESYCAENNHKGIAATAFKGYEVADWHDSRGKKIKNWKQKLQHVWFREENADGKIVAKKETMDEMLDRLQAEGKIPRSPQ